MDEAFQLCNDLIIMDKGQRLLQGAPSKLVEEHMEGYVLEIINAAGEAAVPEYTDVRVEKTAHRTLLYGHDFAWLENLGRTTNLGDYYLRQTNLEDLFLKITGRHLHE